MKRILKNGNHIMLDILRKIYYLNQTNRKRGRKRVLENKIIVIEDKKHIVRKPRSKKDYVVGSEFQKALRDYYEECDKAEGLNKQSPQISNFIGICIMKISTNLGTKGNFSGYDFIQDMVGDAQEKMLGAVILKKYDVEQSNNPVGYFTQIAWNSFLQRIYKEKREIYIKHKSLDALYRELEIDIQEDLSAHMPQNDIHDKVISDFEKPKEKNTGYAIHRNLSYHKNRKVIE